MADGGVRNYHFCVRYHGSSSICMRQAGIDSADHFLHHGQNKEKEKTPTTVLDNFLSKIFFEGKDVLKGTNFLSVFACQHFATEIVKVTFGGKRTLRPQDFFSQTWAGSISRNLQVLCSTLCALCYTFG